MSMAAISQQIWVMKYRFKTPEGAPVDETIEDTWRRVARALARIERDPAHWEQAFYGALEDFQFLPAGRIVAGAGTERSVTLFNCFVMGTIPDDMGGIFDQLREAALTLQQGGGIGYDFSTIRPKGAVVKGVGADASGPLSFMDVWDAMCRTIMSAGYRRGAMMATLRCDHPDIEAFIEAKREPGRLRMFNLSVLATDPFMAAVKADAAWDLVFDSTVYRTVRARELWDRIMQATYDYAEPGVIFIDRINRRNNLAYCETIAATNPCGEVPLPPYGACLLGSINLARLVRRPFEPDAALDLDRLGVLVPLAVRMMDNVVDVSRFPLEQQEIEAKAKRRIGLGVTGFADALILCGVRYGSPAAVALTERWMAAIRRAAYAASIDLAREKGAFPQFDRDAYLAGESIGELDADIRDGIAQHGIRNALLTSIAPTGTISLFADNVSSGLEPVFSFHYTRTVLMRDGTRQDEEVSDYAYRLFRALKGAEAPLPDWFVDAQGLTPDDHVVMQAAVQKYIDNSISKTINVPADIAFGAFQDVYRKAYELGCKGCTTYRPNEVTGSVLSVPVKERSPDMNLPAPPIEAPVRDQSERPPAPAEAVQNAPTESAEVIQLTEPLARPEALPGQTYKLCWPESDHAIYITINDVMQDGRRRPFEMFINSKNMDHYAWSVGLTRMISAVFRRGGDVSFVVEELKAVFDPRGGAWMDGRYVPSLLAAIGDVIARHLVAIGFMAEEAEEELPLAQVGIAGVASTAKSALATCPGCGAAALVRQEGCSHCTSCGQGKCG
jgi:ribonucleoside-diphosphate reductase alpha chain